MNTILLLTNKNICAKVYLNVSDSCIVETTLLANAIIYLLVLCWIVTRNSFGLSVFHSQLMKSPFSISSNCTNAIGTLVTKLEPPSLILDLNCICWDFILFSSFLFTFCMFYSILFVL